MAAQIRAGGGSADAVALDVTSDASVAAALAALPRPVDVLVNNAGLQHVAPLEEFPMAKWDFLIQVMLVGVGAPDARGAARHARARLRPHRQHRQHPFPGRQPVQERLRRRQARPARASTRTIALETADVDITDQHHLSQLREDAAGGQADRRPGAHARHPGVAR